MVFLSRSVKIKSFSTLGTIFVFLFFFVFLYIQAASATMYVPGETLEPNCAPGPGCGVTPSNIGSTDLTLSGARLLTLNGNSLTFDGTTGDIVFSDNGNVSIGGTLLIPSVAQFSPIAFPSNSEGLLFYNTNDKALTYYNDEAGTHINIGQDTVVRVRNETGSIIAKGSAVYISGTSTDLSTPKISLALADSFDTATVLGLVKSDIGNNQYGYVATGGIIHNLDTSSFTAGDIIYLSAATPGAFTTTAPTHPNNLVPIGYVTKQNGSTGEIYVAVKTAIRRVFTPGSVVFANATTGDLNFDNTNFFWDDTSKRLGIGDNTPAASLTVGSGDLFEVFGASGNVTTQGDIVLATGGGSIMATGGGLALSGAGASSLSTSSGVLTLAAAGAGTTSTVQIGIGGAGSTTPDFLALDVKSTAGNPAGGAEGDMYYNTSDNKFRCYEDIGWKDCIVSSVGLSDPMTTIGDMIFRDGSNVTTRLPVGTNDQILTISGGIPTWVNAAAGFADPMTTEGDIIYRDSSNTSNRLALGSNGQVLTSNGTDLIWGSAAGSISSVFGRTGVVIANPGDYTSLDTLTVNNSLTIPNYIDFTSSTPPAQVEGRLFYNTTDKALEYFHGLTDPSIRLGFETMFRAKNTTGSSIPHGSVVYVNGGDGLGNPTIALAKADVLATSSAAGFTEEVIADGTYGTVHILGVINDVDTSSITGGSVIYLSATTAGAFTSTRPPQPNYTITLGRTLDQQFSGTIMSEISTTTQPGTFGAGSVAFGGTDGLIKQDSTNLFWDDSLDRLGIGDNTPAASLTVGSGDLFEVFGATGNLTTAGDITLGTGGGTIASAGGALTINSASATTLTLDSGTTGSVLIGTGVAAKTITIGNASDDTFSIASSGLNVSTAGALTGVTSIGASGNISTSGNIFTTGSGTVTSAATLTASSGLTMTTGALSLTSTSGSVSSTGLTALTQTLSSGTAAITAPTLNLNTSATGNTAIGNATGTFSLASNGGLNITTGGVLTGVASIDTISTSATALTFAGAGTITGTTTLTLNSTGANAITLDSTTTGAINIGTGTSGKTIHIGDGIAANTITIGNASDDTFSIASSGLNVSTAGALTGVTSIGASGTISTSGNISTTGSGTITSAGILTGSSDISVTGSWKGSVSTTATTDSGTTSTIATKALAYYFSSTDTTGSCATGTKTFNITGLTDTEGSHAFIVSKAIDGGCGSSTLTLTVSINGATISTVANANSGGTVTENYEVAYINGSWRILGTPSTADGADLAEMYAINDESIEAGDVVSLDPTLKYGVKKSIGVNNRGVIGIVSTTPAMIIGGTEVQGVLAVPVALSGRVPVKINTENGTIEPGDYLSSSSIPGVAMKSNGTGSVIGLAMNVYNNEGVDMALALVKNFDLGEIADDTLLLGDISPQVNADGSANGLSTLVASIQAETPRNPISIISQKIADGTQFLTNFVTARITAIRGYFDEIFARKVHTDELCIKKSDGSEVCFNGEQVQNLLNNNTTTTTPSSISEPAPTINQDQGQNQPASSATPEPSESTEPDEVLIPEVNSDTVIDIDTAPADDATPVAEPTPVEVSP